MNHQHVISLPDGTTREVILNDPQHRAYQAIRPGATVALPWGRGVGLSWFTRFAWYALVAEHDYRPRKEVSPPWPRGVRIVHVVPSASTFREEQGDLIQSEAAHYWAPLGGKFNRTEMSIRFPGGSSVRIVGASQMLTLCGWRADAVTTHDADALDVSRFDAMALGLLSEASSLRTVLLGGLPHAAPYGLLSRAAKDPRAVTIPATYRDVPETVDPAYVEQLRATMAPDLFAREWECRAA